MSELEVIVEVAGSCGVITLNRPSALNALTLGMVREMARALDRWETDPSVHHVIVKGGGDKAFCAGGDIRILYELGKAGRYGEQLSFWREEYCLNRRIKLYAKPIIALVDGIVMGGGAGISVHASHLVAGDNLSFAMPEVGIGFCPDVGASFFLPRLAGRSGLYLALTGTRMTCGDALAFGLAHIYVPSTRHADLLGRLIGGEDLRAAIAAETAPPPASALSEHRALIDRCFAAPTLLGILAELDKEGHKGVEFARVAAETIRSKSPTSLAIALHQMRIGASLNIDEALKTEFRLVSRIARNHDFYEGVRAVIIDKDNRPHWEPAEIENLTAADIESYFAPLPEGELEFHTQVCCP
jgi:enoyl-CoA hydratase